MHMYIKKKWKSDNVYIYVVPNTYINVYQLTHVRMVPYMYIVCTEIEWFLGLARQMSHTQKWTFTTLQFLLNFFFFFLLSFLPNFFLSTFYFAIQKKNNNLKKKKTNFFIIFQTEKDWFGSRSPATYCIIIE